MRSFFSAKQRPQLPPNRTLIKVALLGDEGVGKTSLMVRFTEGAFEVNHLRDREKDLDAKAAVPCAGAVDEGAVQKRAE